MCKYVGVWIKDKIDGIGKKMYEDLRYILFVFKLYIYTIFKFYVYMGFFFFLLGVFEKVNKIK